MRIFILEQDEENPEFEMSSSAASAGDAPAFNPNLLKSVNELELSVRAYNCMRNADIKIIADLVERTEPEMLKTKNFGRKSLNEIKEMLQNMGLNFGMKIDREMVNKMATSQVRSVVQDAS